jgi:hypothetical protein
VFFICIVLLALYLIQNTNVEPLFNKSRCCCLYSYYEKNEKYLNNFKFFIKNGILNHVDYYIIINGDCSFNIENELTDHLKHVTIIYRKNIGYDFGAYCYTINNHIKIKYDYYFFINTSVKGPYLNTKESDWTVPFINLFNENVQVVGTSINIYHPDHDITLNKLNKLYNKKNVYSHVQSMFFCIKYNYFEFLKQNDFFNCNEINNMDMKDLIILKEIGLSQLALNNGWNINCILSKYKDIDYKSIEIDFNDTSIVGDPYFKNAYFLNTIDPYEVIFFKNNRF